MLWKIQKVFKGRIVRAVTIADLHGAQPWLPSADMLIIAGDATKHGDTIQLAQFDNYIENKKNIFRYILFTAGNHDRDLAFNPYLHSTKVYINESVVIEGIHFWLSPYAVANVNGFMFTEKEHHLKEIWNKIPSDVDVVVTHCPPYGILDKIDEKYLLDKEVDPHVGSRTLLWKIQEIKPKYHIFGHIHEQAGMVEIDGTTFINASNIHNPIVIDI